MNLHSPTLHPFFAPYDSGAGSGGSGGSSSSSGSYGTGAGAGSSGQGQGQGQATGQGSGSGSGGGQGGGQGQGSGQSGTGTAYRVTDDSLMDLGDGKPVKWSEAKQRYVPREEHDKLVGTFNSSKKLLYDYAKQLDEGFKALENARRGGQGQRQEQAPDVLAELENEPVVDGRMVARLVKDLRERNLGPLAQIVAKQQAAIENLSKQLTNVSGISGSLAEHHQSREFEGFITDHLKNVGEVKGLNAVNADHPVIRDIAQDLWLSYDAKTWTPTEFRKMLNARLSGLVDYILTDQKAAVEAAKAKRRNFFAPGQGRGTASGEGGQFKFRRGLDIARESGLFNSAAA